MRLRQLTPEHLGPEQRELYERINGQPRGAIYALADGSLEGPFNAMLHHPTVGDPLQALGAALRYKGSLNPRARELAILTVAATYQAEYEWYAHAPIAAALGLDEPVLDAIARGERPALESEVEQTVIDVTRKIMARGDLDDQTWAQVSALLSEPELVELTTLVGFYVLLAVQMRIFRVPIPAGVPQRFSKN